MAGSRETASNCDGPLSLEQRILLVEDEPTTREMLTSVLRQEGHAVDSVATAGAADTCMKSIAYAVVISDWFLPDGNGGDVADAAMNAGAKTLIISDFDIELAEAIGSRHELLSKRLGPSALLAAVERAMNPK
jgi:DNA-binding response OmpR family regulator